MAHMHFTLREVLVTADTGRPSSLSVLAAAAEGPGQRFPEEELLHKIPKSSQEARKVLLSEEISERTQPLVAHGSYTSPPSSPSLLSLPSLSPSLLLSPLRSNGRSTFSP